MAEREVDAAGLAPDVPRTLGPEGRQARITELVLSTGAVSAQELAETFGVSR